MLPESIPLLDRVSIHWIRIPIKATILYLTVYLNLDTTKTLFVVATVIATEIADFYAENVAKKHPEHRFRITFLIGLLNFTLAFLLLIMTNLQYSELYLLLYAILIASVLPTNMVGGLVHGLLGAILYTLMTYKGLDQFTMTFHATVFLFIGTLTGLLAESNRRNNQIATFFKEQVSHQKEASNLKNDFLAIAYHTLRTPLTEIKGFHYLLGETTDKKSRGDLITRMGISLNKIQSIVDNILRIVEFESNTTEQNVTTIDVGAMLNKILSDLKPLTASKQVSTNLVLGQSLGQTPIELDQTKIEMAIKNIIDNAIRYSQPNSVVEIEAKESVGTLTISIKDQGKGIAPEQMPYIFEKFHRIDVLTPDNNEGLGVGLYLANRVIQQHNGKIDVQSQPNQGTTVTISLPKQTSSAFMDKF